MLQVKFPFIFVEKHKFRKFNLVAQPLFKVPCKKILAKNFLKLSDKSKFGTPYGLPNYVLTLGKMFRTTIAWC